MKKFPKQIFTSFCSGWTVCSIKAGRNKCGKDSGKYCYLFGHNDGGGAFVHAYSQAAAECAVGKVAILLMDTDFFGCSSFLYNIA